MLLHFLHRNYIKKHCIFFNVKSEAFASVMTEVEVLWVMILCSDAIGYPCIGRTCCLHQPKDGGNKVLHNMGILSQYYMAS
jgi:hypothetical protein